MCTKLKLDERDVVKAGHIYADSFLIRAAHVFFTKGGRPTCIHFMPFPTCINSSFKYKLTGFN